MVIVSSVLFFGREYFDVKNKADPSNLAYTTDFIPFHVDLLYLTRAPDVSAMSCDKKPIFPKALSESLVMSLFSY